MRSAAAAAARRSVMIGGGGVSKMSAAAAVAHSAIYDMFIHLFIHLFAQQVTLVSIKTLKTYCKVSWTTRQCTYCCP